MDPFKGVISAGNQELSLPKVDLALQQFWYMKLFSDGVRRFFVVLEPMGFHFCVGNHELQTTGRFF